MHGSVKVCSRDKGFRAVNARYALHLIVANIFQMGGVTAIDLDEDAVVTGQVITFHYFGMPCSSFTTASYIELFSDIPPEKQ